MKENKKTKQFKTFQNWPFKEDFFAETDQQGYIMSLVGKAFCDSLAHIGNKARLRRINKGSVNVSTYADGVVSIHLANVEKHIKARGLQDWGKRKYPGGCSSSTWNLQFFWNDLSWK